MLSIVIKCVIALFSRCAKVLPLAVGVYQDGLPLHYVRAIHLAKVSRCVVTLALYKLFTYLVAARVVKTCNKVCDSS